MVLGCTIMPPHSDAVQLLHTLQNHLSMKKKAQVHMLPTEQRSQIALHDRLGLITASSQGWDEIKEQSYIKPQHLYFTTDEEIKEGDWFLYKQKLVLQHDGSIQHDGSMSTTPSHCEKIVATTNPKLHPYNRSTTWEHDDYEFNDGMGIIGDDFVKAFVREQGGIKEVMLEYEYPSNGLYHDSMKPKVLTLRPNGTIIISPVKEKMYTRSELIDACYEFKLFNQKIRTEGRTMSFSEWFDKNYPE